MSLYSVIVLRPIRFTRYLNVIGMYGFSYTWMSEILTLPTSQGKTLNPLFNEQHSSFPQTLKELDARHGTGHRVRLGGTEFSILTYVPRVRLISIDLR